MIGPDRRSEAFLGQLAAEANKELPRRIDDDTEMTHVSAGPGIIMYHYRLPNVSSAELKTRPGAFDIFGAGAAVRKRACEVPELRDELLKHGVVVRYRYVGNDDKLITGFDVKPSQCGFKDPPENKP